VILRVYTSRYQNPNVASEGRVAYGITAYPPRFPLKFKLSGNLQDLAPTREMLRGYMAKRLNDETFRQQYIARLNALGADQVKAILTEAQGEASGIVLLCFEDVHAGQTCHRSDLARWLQEHLGLVVDEM
jgi:uncharacterized protein YeaO (DUF488 family)